MRATVFCGLRAAPSTRTTVCRFGREPVGPFPSVPSGDRKASLTAAASRAHAPLAPRGLCREVLRRGYTVITGRWPGSRRQTVNPHSASGVLMRVILTVEGCHVPPRLQGILSPFGELGQGDP
jgi:hypothetical protein